MAVTHEELQFASLETLAGLVRSKQVHPRELVEGSLRRIEELDGRLNAFRVTMADEALAAADAAADSDGPLCGVPVAIKDEMPVAGQALTVGSRTYGPPAADDSEAVRRLRAAGAIPVGITNVPELTIWPWTASDANGITRNPWDLIQDARRLLRWVGGRRCRRNGGGSNGFGRRGVDPHTGGMLRPGGDEAHSRPCFAEAGS